MPEGPSVQDLSVLACCRLGITQIMQQPQIPTWSCGASLPAPPGSPPTGAEARLHPADSQHRLAGAGRRTQMHTGKA